MKKMTRDEFDAMVRDLFRNGGPMRPVSGGWKITTARKKPGSSAVLEAELQRLVRTWGKA
jgi:hypothetical protein